MRKNIVSKLWIMISVIIAALTAVAAYCGAFVQSTYAKESVSWAAQGMGQDLITLFLVVPALVISAYFLSKGSLKALLIWLGALIYIEYSYVLYSFFIHFGWTFLLYVAILGLSFYTIIGSLHVLDLKALKECFSFNGRTKIVSGFLMLSGIMFVSLWLSDIIPAVSSGSVPKGVVELGFLVNPVHVLDLAFFLPGLIITSVLLWRKDVLGAFFAVPMMVFQVLMGAALVSMIIMQNAKGSSEPLTAAYIMSFLVLVTMALIILSFGNIKAKH